jgi:hypothetical protein
MSGFELQTAKYLGSTAEPIESEEALEANPVAEKGSSPSGLEKAAGWIGVGAAGMVVLCLVLIAIPKVTGIKLPKAASPLDWMLWFGGAESDQTFNKFLKDSAAKNQQEWDERYRQSPMYQFQGMKPIDLNTMQGVQFNGQGQSGRR